MRGYMLSNLKTTLFSFSLIACASWAQPPENVPEYELVLNLHGQDYYLCFYRYVDGGEWVLYDNEAAAIDSPVYVGPIESNRTINITYSTDHTATFSVQSYNYPLHNSLSFDCNAYFRYRNSQSSMMAEK